MWAKVVSDFYQSEMWTRWRQGMSRAHRGMQFALGKISYYVCVWVSVCVCVCVCVCVPSRGRGKGGQRDFLVNDLLVKTDRQAWKHFWEEKPHLQLHNPLSVKSHFPL